jgi:hypothetical protein
MSKDKVIKEKVAFQKASWELPETESTQSSMEQMSDVPTNYEALSPSYTDSTTFEVKKSPGKI